MTPTVPDGPDTELAAAIAWFGSEPQADPLILIEGSCTGERHAATIVRAVLARPAAGRDLTAQDVDEAVMASTDPNGAALQSIADRLNAVARPAVARTDGQPPADEDERAVVEMEHRDRRDRAVRSVAARLRAIRGGYDHEADTIAVRHVLRAESDPPVRQSVRQLSEAIVDYSIRPPFAAAPADDTGRDGST